MPEPNRSVTRGKKKPVAVKRMPGYIVMICGHYTTAEAQVVLFSAAGKRFPKSYTRKTKFYCETCGRYNKPYTFTENEPATVDEALPFLGKGVCRVVLRGVSSRAGRT